MENKTKEQLLDKYIKDKHSQDECSGWIDGWDARQPEIDALKERLKNECTCFGRYICDNCRDEECN